MNSPSKYVFLIGAPDDRQATIAGFDAEKKIVYNWDGHTEFAQYLNVPAAEKEYWYLLPFAPDRFAISVPHIILNGIANADNAKDSLAMAENILRDVRKNWPQIPVFNAPQNILKTTRERIYADFHHLPGLEIPKTMRFRPTSVHNILDQAAQADFTFPYLLRRCGAHRGDDLIRITGPEDAHLLERFAYDGADYYLTQFRDYRAADGLYTKTRFIMLDGRFYPRHAITSDHWAVHAASRRFMAGNNALKQREAETLAKLENLLSPAARDSVQKIYDATGLDYLGFDGCILPDGKLLVFEINASQYAMAPSDYAEFPYLEPYVAAIVGAFNAVIFNKCLVTNALKTAAHV